MTEKKISGPVNTVRLEGNVFGIDKILYVFFDYHRICSRETNCGDLFSEPIQLFLAKQFQEQSKKSTIIDFFLEFFPTMRMNSEFTKYKQEIYIIELRKLFAKSLSYSISSDKVSESKLFPKVRFHYIDIRDYLFYNLLFHADKPLLKQYLGKLTTQQDIIRVKDILKKIILEVNFVMDILFQQTGGKQIIKLLSDELGPLPREKILELINKLKNRYNHPEIKKVVHLMMDKYLKDGLQRALKMLESIFLLLDAADEELGKNPKELNVSADLHNLPKFCSSYEYGPNIDLVYQLQFKINTIFSEFEILIMDCSVIFIDAYFLRRFLDKDYVTHGIVYTGGFHSRTYIYILTKYFQFKVTHASYSKYDLPTLNKKLKTAELNREFYELFLPDELIQCSNLTEFPENFE
ncbi:MAG: hypothetical protein Harvfovirus18_5 [Harvfovirus sp.]|uniref:Uncharacterized protein n=1 Tax=Harvfovirus sp. TaxID=2487768 RepID=A0A3G5A1P5_9VIRU|nr:MAG: hypothetical protein Harvfovirus18_5 [Harvfovirus sp.]